MTIALAGVLTCGLGVRMAVSARRAVRLTASETKPVPRARRAPARRRAVRAATEQVPALVDTMLAGVLAGQALTEAFDAAAEGAGEPLGSRLAPARRAVHLGTPLPTVLRTLAADPVLGHLAAALTLTYETGANAAAPLRGLASALRDSAAAAREARALSATARAQARLLAGLPVGVLALSLLAEPAHLATVLGSTTGQVAIGAGLVLDAGGLLAIRYLAKPL